MQPSPLDSSGKSGLTVTLWSGEFALTIVLDVPKTTCTAITLINRAEGGAGPFKSAIRSAIFEAFKTLFTKLQPSDDQKLPISSADAEALPSVISKSMFNVSDVGLSEAIRQKRAEAIAALAKIEWRGVAETVLKEQLGSILEAEKSPMVKSELEKARKAFA